MLTSSPPGLPSALAADEIAAAPQLAAVAEGAKDAEPFIPTLQPIQANVSEFVQILGAVRPSRHSLPPTTRSRGSRQVTVAELQRAIPLH